MIQVQYVTGVISIANAVKFARVKLILVSRVTSEELKH